MNKHTLENIIIFSVIYCNSWNNNEGRVYASYIKEKSERYIGIDLTNHPNLSIDDFGNKYIEDGYSGRYPDKPLRDILNNLKNKIDISKLSNDKNIYLNEYNLTYLDDTYVIYGVDFSNTKDIIGIINSYGDEYFNKILREYNINFILDE